jgi:hypothetical protein
MNLVDDMSFDLYSFVLYLLSAFISSSSSGCFVPVSFFFGILCSFNNFNFTSHPSLPHKHPIAYLPPTLDLAPFIRMLHPHRHITGFNRPPPVELIDLPVVPVHEPVADIPAFGAVQSLSVDDDLVGERLSVLDVVEAHG